MKDVLDQFIGHRFGPKFDEHAVLITLSDRMKVAYFVVSDRWYSTMRHRVADIRISQRDAATPWAMVVFYTQKSYQCRKAMLGNPTHEEKARSC